VRVEVLLLWRVYRAPELYQLLLTFALVLLSADAVRFFWGADNKTGPSAPGLSGSVRIAGQLFPSYDLAVIALGPLVALAPLLPHTLGRAHPGRHAGSRDGRGPRRRSVAPLHRRVRPRLVSGRSRRRAPGAARGAHDGHGHDGDRRGVRGRRDRRDGLGVGRAPGVRADRGGRVIASGAPAEVRADPLVQQVYLGDDEVERGKS
jgi:hypothetical protein